MSKDKKTSGVHFHGPVSFSNGSAFQSGDHATFTYNAAAPGFAKDLEAIHAELIKHQDELGATVVEGLGNLLRLLAREQPNASDVQARLAALEDDKFIQEALPQLRSGSVDWQGVMSAAKVAAETAKALVPLLKLLP